MAIKLNHDIGGLEENHDINVTPFIDVMLVLLIIFMVTAPLTTVDVPVNLPASNAEPKPPEAPPVTVTLQSDLSVAVGDTHVSRDAVGTALDKATKGDHQAQIFLRADKSVDYGHLMELLNVLRSSGYLKVALVGLDSASNGPDHGAPTQN